MKRFEQEGSKGEKNAFASLLVSGSKTLESSYHVMLDFETQTRMKRKITAIFSFHSVNFVLYSIRQHRAQTTKTVTA